MFALDAETECFAQRCIDGISAIVPLSSCAFYRVDDDFSPRGWLLHRVEDHLHRIYLDCYQHLDPLHPMNFGIGRHAVLPMNEVFPWNERINSPYGEFMSRNDIVDVVELFMRSEGRIVAGFSLLRSAELGGFDNRDLITLGHLHGLLEMASARALPASKAAPNGCILARLTPREREVAFMLRDGDSNKVMAQKMGVGLATVKTHLIQMFRKIGVANRTEFVSRVFLNG